MLMLLFMTSCGLFQQNTPEITTIDSTNFYQVFDSTKYRGTKPSDCSDSIFKSNGYLYTTTKLKAANLDSSNMSNLSIKLMISRSPLVDYVMMNSKDSTIIIHHQKYCLSSYDIMETLVMNGAVLMKK